ncbi:MAG: hypothetical protein EKK34_14710 [Mycobacterium sp.]|nr:MAG: hypothetical protein EKK34_14710 [Mycobacterium sp.]
MTMPAGTQGRVSVGLLRLVQVNTTTAEAAIAAVEEYGADPETLLIRLGVMQLLKLQLESLRAIDEDEAALLASYRRWVEVGLDYMGPAPETTGRDYALASSLLNVEMHFASGGRTPVGGRGAIPFELAGES